MKQLPNLLIVDDTWENLVYLEALTRKIKVNLIKAGSGIEALEKARGIDIALAILDVSMPGMNGFELAIKLNAARSGDKIPVIFLTANQINETQEFKGYISGAADFISKPINNKILLCKIEVFLDLFEQKQAIIRYVALLKKTADKLSRTNKALKKREEKLNQEQLFTKALLDSIPGIFYLYTYPELKMVTWNKQHETLFGYDASEMKGRHALDWHLPETREVVSRSLDSFIQMGQSSIETPLIAKDGHEIPFILTAVKFESRGQNYLIGIGTDVTGRKIAEKSLQQSETTLTKAQQIAHMGSWELELATNELQWSDETFRIFGYAPGSVSPSLELFFRNIHPQDISYVHKSIKGTRDSGTPYCLDHRIVLSDGTERIVHEQAEVMNDDAGRPMRWRGIVQDITERKKTEEELKSSLGQLQLLTQYIEQVRENERVAISRELHDDLGQALTAVKIDLGIIRQSISDNDAGLRLNKVAALVGETIKTVQRLTSQLRPEIIDDLGLGPAIEWYTNEFAQRIGVEVFLDIDPVITISPNISLIIFRIMQESLTNIARHSRATRVDIALGKKDDFITFRVLDNGIGITEKQRIAKNAFGLISMKERAASLKGTFEIASKNGKGTLITLSIPILKS